MVQSPPHLNSAVSTGVSSRPLGCIVYFMLIDDVTDAAVCVCVQCSFYPPCRSSRVENEDAVADYQSKYGLPGSEYPCWYNPDRPSQVIQHHRFHLHHVINGVAGSTAVLATSVVLLVCVVRHRRFFKTEWHDLTWSYSFICSLIDWLIDWLTGFLSRGYT